MDNAELLDDAADLVYGDTDQTVTAMVHMIDFVTITLGIVTEAYDRGVAAGREERFERDQERWLSGYRYAAIMVRGDVADEVQRARERYIDLVTSMGGKPEVPVLTASMMIERQVREGRVVTP